MATPYVSGVHRAYFLAVKPLITKAMLELFIELTNQIFWTGYAQELAKSDPAVFQLEFDEFLNTHQN